MKITVEDIARVAHEANRAFCVSMGDASQLPWIDAPEWQKDSALNGVIFLLQNPYASNADSHESWFKEKAQHGWAWGPVKDEAKRLHPCMLPYHELPEEQRVKDALFVSVVRSLERLL